MNVNSCYPVRHTLHLLAGAESVPSVTLSRVTGYHGPRGRPQRPIIRSTRTLRIRHTYGLDLSNAPSISLLPAASILTRSDFHEVSRAAGPKGHTSKAMQAHQRSDFVLPYGVTQGLYLSAAIFREGDQDFSGRIWAWDHNYPASSESGQAGNRPLYLTRFPFSQLPPSAHLLAPYDSRRRGAHEFAHLALDIHRMRTGYRANRARPAHI